MHRNSEIVKLTIPEAAELFGCSERTIHRLIATGRIESMKVGRTRHVLGFLYQPEVKLTHWGFPLRGKS